jgi:hypothetical protein
VLCRRHLPLGSQQPRRNHRWAEGVVPSALRLDPTDWSLNLDDKVATHGASIYRDKYVKVGGAWKIKRATYTRVYEQVDHLKELPNITAHYLGGMLKPGPA